MTAADVSTCVIITVSTTTTTNTCTTTTNKEDHCRFLSSYQRGDCSNHNAQCVDDGKQHNDDSNIKVRPLAPSTKSSTILPQKQQQPTNNNAKNTKFNIIKNNTNSNYDDDDVPFPMSSSQRGNDNDDDDHVNNASHLDDDDNDDDDEQQQLHYLDIDDAIECLGMGYFQRRILWAAGLCFAADAMEIMLLSFLAVVLQDAWQLTNAQTATLTSSVFLGALVGTLCLGTAGDVYGRRPVFTGTALIIAFFGLATAATNSFHALLLTRVMVGFGVGGLTVPFDTLAEFIPASHRGVNLLIIEYFWVAGSLLVPVVAYLSLERGGSGEGPLPATAAENNMTVEEDVAVANDNGWRLLVLGCALPCLFATALGYWYVPESPRWLLSTGQHRRAVQVLRQAALCNGHDPDRLFPLDRTRLVDSAAAAAGATARTATASTILATTTTTTSKATSSVFDLWTPQWRYVTACLWFSWTGFAFVYYGTIMAVTRLFAHNNSDMDSEHHNDNDPHTTTKGYHFDYFSIFTAASAELAGTTLVILLIDRIGRTRTQSISYFGGGVSVLILCLLAAAATEDATSRHPHGGLLLFWSFMARLCFMSGTCSTWISTAEIYSTEIRTTGHAYSNAIARIGGAVSPFLVTRTTPWMTVGVVLCVVSVLTALSTSQLPETAGHALGTITTTTMTTTYTTTPLDIDTSSDPEDDNLGMRGIGRTELTRHTTAAAAAPIRRRTEPSSLRIV